MSSTATMPVGQARAAVTARTATVRRRRSAPLTIGMFALFSKSRVHLRQARKRPAPQKWRRSTPGKTLQQLKRCRVPK